MRGSWWSTPADRTSYPFKMEGKFSDFAQVDSSEEFILADFLAEDPDPKSLTELTLFLKLCAELQFKIWAHAYADVLGRIMTIEPPLVEVPALLQTCLDSSKIGLGIYNRTVHPSKPGVPSFVSIINFATDGLNLTIRGKYRNPQGEDKSHYSYHIGDIHIIITWKHNLLFYTIDTYPDVCKYFKHVTVRNCYLKHLEKRNEWKQHIDGIFEKNFPVLERAGTNFMSAVGDMGYAETRCSWWMRDDIYTELSWYADDFDDH